MEMGIRFPDRSAGNRSTLSEYSASPRFHEGRLVPLRLDGKRRLLIPVSTRASFSESVNRVGRHYSQFGKSTPLKSRVAG